MKKIFLGIMFMCILYCGCDSYNKNITSIVETINYRCPLILSSEGSLDKVEYIDSTIFFYATYKELDEIIDNLPYGAIRRIEGNLNTKQKTMHEFMMNHNIRYALKDLSIEDAFKNKLKFKFIIGGKKSKNKIEFIMSLQDVMAIYPDYFYDNKFMFSE